MPCLTVILRRASAILHLGVTQLEATQVDPARRQPQPQDVDQLVELEVVWREFA